MTVPPDSSGSVRIQSFTVDSDGLEAPGEVRLCWSVRGASRVVLSGHGRVPPSQRRGLVLTVSTTTTFVLTAYGRGFNEIAAEACTVTVAPQRPSPSIPIGAIALWAGDPTDIPPGWRLCDGRSGTPALVDRFVLGAGEHAAAGTSGGGDPHKHAVTVRLTGRTGETPGHHHTRPQGWSTDKAAGNDGPFALAAADRLAEGGADAHDVAAEIAWSTSEQPAAEPPWYALCVIVRIGEV